VKRSQVIVVKVSIESIDFDRSNTSKPNSLVLNLATIELKISWLLTANSPILDRALNKKISWNIVFRFENV